MASAHECFSKNAALSTGVYKRYAELDGCSDKVAATYVWVDPVFGYHPHSKTKILDKKPSKPSDCPDWDVAGPDMQEFLKNDHAPILEHILKPVAIYKDPFLRGDNVLVFCETFNTDGTPSSTNFRNSCKKTMDLVKKQKPWFGFEQEYFIVDVDGHPIGWPKNGVTEQPIGMSHSAAGASTVLGREIADSHLRACLYCGLDIFGINSEAILSQWEYQLGPVEGIDAADQLYMSRFILQRVAEDFGLDITMACKPVEAAPYNFTTGCHCNFSTEDTRNPKTGKEAMELACKRLAPAHAEHLAKYDSKEGKDNVKRLSKEQLEQYSWGVGSRESSVRIPVRCFEKGYGYIEDRRPAGDADPYLVSEMLVKSICLAK